MSRKLESKIKTPIALRRLLAGRKGKQKVVFTNGCFDLIHKGHVRYLQKARSLGDLLVVALNSDESVRRLKGASRPINSLPDRLEVLAALECVDYVTWFEEDTPLELIVRLHPDYLVKGGDWRPSDIVGSSEVLSWGGKVRSLPFVSGYSTTRLIEKSRS